MNHNIGFYIHQKRGIWAKLAKTTSWFIFAIFANTAHQEKVRDCFSEERRKLN
jgi:hypothetical protein